MRTIFSNLRKLLLDRYTGSYVATNKSLETVEGFYYFEQPEPNTQWHLQHDFENPNYIIAIYVQDLNGGYTRAWPNFIKNDNTRITVDFNTVEAAGYACVLFVENDLTIIPTSTITPTITPTPTPTPSG